MSAAQQRFSTVSPGDVRGDLLARREIALLDVREEEPHATSHPLFAANLPLSRIELEAYTRLPRRSVPIVLFDDGEGHAEPAAHRLSAMGYTQVRLLRGGLQGWRDEGYELFRDVNAPSKAFGELVEAKRHTPSFSAQEVQSLIVNRADVVIVDARRYEEFQTMSIPTAVSMPGAELVLRIRELAPRPETQIIVNCAGRTRSIIGTQSLINAGIPNPVAALRNGTIGWKLAQQQLAHGASDRFGSVQPDTQSKAAKDARNVANKAGVHHITAHDLPETVSVPDVTTYRFDVRTPEEFLHAHIPGFLNTPGGQLVQETDMFAPVRGARILLVDDDGVRANMTGSWLAQMGWNVSVLEDFSAADFTQSGPSPTLLPAWPVISDSALLSPAELSRRNDAISIGETAILDFATAQQYARSHIPGAWYALRSELQQALAQTSHASRYVLTSPDGVAARFAYADFRSLTEKPIHILSDGTTAWAQAGLPLTAEDQRFASDPIDRYRRPYEGTDAPASAMQGYLDWEYGLVDQLARDGTHGFFVI